MPCSPSQCLADGRTRHTGSLEQSAIHVLLCPPPFAIICKFHHGMDSGIFYAMHFCHPCASEYLLLISKQDKSPSLVLEGIGSVVSLFNNIVASELIGIPPLLQDKCALTIDSRLSSVLDAAPRVHWCSSMKQVGEAEPDFCLRTAKWRKCLDSDGDVKSERSPRLIFRAFEMTPTRHQETPDSIIGVTAGGLTSFVVSSHMDWHMSCHGQRLVGRILLLLGHQLAARIRSCR